MADFITKKENARRLAIIIVCVILDAVALAVGIYALKEANFIEKKPENPKRITKLIEDVKLQRETNRAIENDLLSYGKTVGWKFDPAGSVDRFVSAPLQADALKHFLSDIARPAKDREQKGEKSLFQLLGVTKPYKRWDDPGGGENLYLTNLFDELLAKENEFKGKIDQLEKDIKTERDKEEAVKKQTDAENAAVQKDIDGGVAPNAAAAGHIGDYIRLLKELNQLQKSHAEELANLEKETIDAQNKLTETRNDFLRKRAAAEAVKADYKKRINTIVHIRAEAAELREPDGEILSVNVGRELAYISLLRKDRLFQGTKFIVYSLEKGGQKLDKGVIEVVEVREAVSSICSVLKVNSPDWPLKVGDKIYNELYEGGRSRYIAFAGRFTGKLSNEEAANLIRSFGDHYQDKVDEKTNYVVVAEGYEEHPNFKAAQEYGIKILREKILYDYLGVKRD
jgi:hypothetical protein